MHWLLLFLPGPSAPRQLTWLVSNSKGVHLSWMPPAEPNGVIQSYIISYCSGSADTSAIVLSTTTIATSCHTQSVHGKSVDFRVSSLTGESWKVGIFSLIFQTQNSPGEMLWPGKFWKLKLEVLESPRIYQRFKINNV